MLTLPQRQVSKLLQSINREVDPTVSKIETGERKLKPRLGITLFVANKSWEITCLQLPDKSALGLLLF